MEAPDWMESMAAAMTVVVAVVEGKQITAVVTEVLVVGRPYKCPKLYANRILAKQNLRQKVRNLNLVKSQ